ncbi:hypothetical protein [Desulfotignum phosphitoxidans]|jgi:hypothetical protein|uniref:Uncharacterized protein n=1 Tax=Desulfotignum phosphitoxidans DSM 13687 TaxID=1286635 RepID=S0FVC3_9BACT|nr:hypothetical protein [Desulfotignum phosphitoxidans]EMS79058.1 hypothetical protein Dpo_6c02570 [Desulfotignum phosphitoxidans DSM 13687]
MIYEYAIEPDLAVNWGRDRGEYRYYYEKFGIGTPRMMAEFPKLKNWRKLFKQAAAGADETNELPLIEEMFKLLKAKLIYREGVAYDGTCSWLENAEAENKRQAFQAILARTNPGQRANVLTPGSIDDSPFWQVKTQNYCPRQAIDMAELVAAMLVNCSEIHFIDPYFGPEIVRFRRPLEAFIQVLSTRRICRPAIQKITIHTSEKAPIFTFRQTCEEKIKSKIPQGLCVTFYRWKQRQDSEKLHNRYILTDIGGIKVDPGMDDGKAGENFEVILLERTLYEKQWKDFVEKPAFDLSEDPFTIIGNCET